MEDMSTTQDVIRTGGVEPSNSDAAAAEVKQAAEIAKNGRGTFFGILLACAYSYLTIFTTRDSHLLEIIQG